MHQDNLVITQLLPLVAAVAQQQSSSNRSSSSAQYVYCFMQVWKIEDFLAKWSKASTGKGSDDPIAIILMHEIETYTRCLPYLKSSMRGAGEWEDLVGE